MKKNKREIVMYVLIAMFLLSITFGVSYAYWTATITGNEQATETRITSGILDIKFNITDQINNSNIMLVKDEKRFEKAETLDFSVANNGRGNVEGVYHIYITELAISNNLKNKDFKWELVKNNEIAYSGDFRLAETNNDYAITSEVENNVVIPVKQVIGVGEIDNYKLRIWLSETEEDQNNLLNGTFSGKIRVISTQLTGSEKYIELKDASGTLLSKEIMSEGKTNYNIDISNIDLSNSTNIYCNNGGIPTIENNTLKVSEVTDNTECKISNDIQDTIANQLNTTKTGIVMTNNQNGMTSMYLTNKDVVVDLNGKTINGIAVDETSTTWVLDHCGFLLRTATLTVNDSVGTGGIFTGKDGRVFYPIENSNLIINGGSFAGRQAIGVDWNNNNVVTINGGSFDSKWYTTLMIQKDTVITINDGVFNYNGDHENTLSVVSASDTTDLTINGGVFTGKDMVVYSEYITHINGGSFTSNIAKTIYNNGTMTITGGTFESVSSNTVYNTGGTMNISGGIFKSTNNHTVWTNGGTLNISRGSNPIYVRMSSSSDTMGIYSGNNGVLNINADRANNCTTNYQDTTSGLCVYVTNNAYALKGDHSTMNINGGTYKAGSRSIVNEAGAIKIKNANVISTNSDAITNGSWHSVHNNETPGTIDICSSTINGSNYDIKESNTSSYITYSNDNTFSNGTNTPSSNKVYGTINATGASCSW